MAKQAGKWDALLTDARVDRAAAPSQPRLDRLCADLGVDAFADSVASYVHASHDVDHVRGPWTLHGFGADLSRRLTCEQLFGWLGDTPVPALRIGSDRGGIEFWLVVGSGRVITLHHDATLYERAARCRGATAAALTDALADVGSAFDLEQLVRLQIELHDTPWATEAQRQQVWARAAAKVLGVPLRDMVKRADQPPFELLHLEPQLVDELASDAAPKSSKRKAEKLPPQLVEALAEGARTLDLGGVLDTDLPSRVTELVALEEIDLSANPRLDFDDALDQLATLPRLRVVKFADCRLEALPAGFAKLAALEELDLSGSMLKGPDNSFALDQVQPIIAQLPKLRVLDISVCAPPRDISAFIAALPALERLRVASLRKFGGPFPLRLPAAARLQELSIGRLDVDALVDMPPEHLPELRTLRFRDSSVKPLEDTDWRRGVNRRIAQLVDWLARLPALERFELALRGMDLDELPRVIARLRLEELTIEAKRLPPWIGEMRTLRALHVSWMREPPPPEIGQLTNLEVLDFGGSGSDAECRFSTLPDEIGQLTKLRTLIVKPELERWPETLRECRSLEHLQCRGAGPPFLRELASLRTSNGSVDQLVHLPHLERIELSGAPQVPAALAGHTAIRSVWFSAYDFEGDLDAALELVLSLPGLESLKLGCLHRASLPEALVRPPLRSLELSLSNHDRPPLDLALVMPLLAKTKIEHLSLSTLVPVTLPGTLGDVRTLRSLHLCGLAFERLPASIEKLANLRALDLQSTRIGAAERKRIRSVLPGCRITVHD